MVAGARRRRVLPGGPDESAASIQQLYRAQGPVSQGKGQSRDYERLGETEKAGALKAREGPAIYDEDDDTLPALNRGVEELKDIRPRLDDIKADASLTPAEKRAALDRVYEDMVDAAREALGKKPMRRRVSATRRLGDWWTRQTAP